MRSFAASTLLVLRNYTLREVNCHVRSLTALSFTCCGEAQLTTLEKPHTAQATPATPKLGPRREWHHFGCQAQSSLWMAPTPTATWLQPYRRLSQGAQSTHRAMRKCSQLLLEVTTFVTQWWIPFLKLVYLAASGLSCSTQDLHCVMRKLFDVPLGPSSCGSLTQLLWVLWGLSSPTRDRTLHCKILYHWTTREIPTVIDSRTSSF